MGFNTIINSKKNTEKQAPTILDIAISEIQEGKKKSHFIWYIFPQIAGLGASKINKEYVIKDIEEAKEFLKNKEFLEDYTKIINALLTNEKAIPKKTLRKIFGDDAQEVMSSITLFSEALNQMIQGDDAINSQINPLCNQQISLKTDMNRIRGLTYEGLNHLPSNTKPIPPFLDYKDCQTTLDKIKLKPAVNQQLNDATYSPISDSSNYVSSITKINPQIQKVDLLQMGEDKNSAIRVGSTDASKQWQTNEIQSQMSAILKKAIAQTKNFTLPQATMINDSPSDASREYVSQVLSDKNFIINVIDFAKKHNSVGNADFTQWTKFMNGKYKNTQPTNEQKEMLFAIAGELSYRYQEAAKKANFFTGRTEGLRTDVVVGQRLYRIPDAWVQEIVNEAMTSRSSQK